MDDNESSGYEECWQLTSHCEVVHVTGKPDPSRTSYGEPTAESILVAHCTSRAAAIAVLKLHGVEKAYDWGQPGSHWQMPQVPVKNIDPEDPKCIRCKTLPWAIRGRWCGPCAKMEDAESRRRAEEINKQGRMRIYIPKEEEDNRGWWEKETCKKCGCDIKCTICG